MSVAETSSSDLFFYYGVNIGKEIEGELLNLLLNPYGVMLYNRRYGAGVGEFENHPNGLHLQIMLRYQITNAIAFRNSYVTDGSNGTVDRRVAVSQNFISFAPNSGEIDINILYFLLADYSAPKNLSLSTTRTL